MEFCSEFQYISASQFGRRFCGNLVHLWVQRRGLYVVKAAVAGGEGAGGGKGVRIRDGIFLVVRVALGHSTVLYVKESRQATLVNSTWSSTYILQDRILKF